MPNSKHGTGPVAVVGAGLGGLSAAIHLRLAGREVKVYEANARVGGRANLMERAGFRFDTGPSLLNYPWVFEALFAAAGRTLSDYVELLPVDPSIAFQWPDGQRFELSSHAGRLQAACDALEPDAGPGLFRFLADARAKYDLAFDKLVSRNIEGPLSWALALSPRDWPHLCVWRSLYGELGRFFKSARIREALGAYTMYLGGSPFDLPGFFSILPYGELAYGLWLPRGGVYGLVEGMERLARELGAKIHVDAPVARIAVQGGRVRGIVRADGSQEACAAVVSNVDVPTTDTVLLADAPRLERRRRAARRMAMTPGVVTFYWGVKGAVESLGHHTIFLPDDYRRAFDDLFKRRRMPKELPFYVSMPSATDPALAPEGHTALFVLAPAPVPGKAGATPDVDVEAVRAQVLERLASHGVRIDMDALVINETLTPADWGTRFGLYGGSAFGAAHGLFQVGPFRAPNYAKAVRGLYYAGASTVPGTGMPLVAISGRLAAERVLRDAH